MLTNFYPNFTYLSAELWIVSYFTLLIKNVCFIPNYIKIFEYFGKLYKSNPIR